MKLIYVNVTAMMKTQNLTQSINLINLNAYSRLEILVPKPMNSFIF